MRDLVKVTLIAYILILIISEFVFFSARYAFYILPFMVVGLSVLTQKITLDRFNKNLIKLGFIMVLTFFPAIVSFIEGNTYYMRFLKELIFILPIYAMAIAVKKSINPDQFSKYLSFFVVALLVVFFVKDFATIGSLLSNFRSFLLSSKSDTESTYASVYGVICVYFFVTKRYKYFFLALLLVIIGSKRIVLGGVIVSVIVGSVIERLNLSTKLVIFGGITANVLMVSVLVGLSSGAYDMIIREYTGLSTNQLVMGRAVIYKAIFVPFDTFSLYGAGIGSTSFYLQNANFLLNDSRLLHSDLLKLYLELGVVLFMAYLYVFYKFFEISRKSIYVLLYVNVLYLTGNTLIFVHVNIIVYLILTALYVKYENTSGVPPKVRNTPNY